MHSSVPYRSIESELCSFEYEAHKNCAQASTTEHSMDSNNNIIELAEVASTGFSSPGANRSQSPLCKQIGGNKIRLFIISQ